MSNSINCVNLGDAFLLDSPPNGKHLFVAIIDLTATKYLFVSVTKKVNNSDLSCVIKPSVGVPPFIIQESVIYYKNPREIELTTIQKLIDMGKCIYKGSFSPNILYRIQEGATKSDRIPQRYETLVKNYLGIN